MKDKLLGKAITKGSPSQCLMLILFSKTKVLQCMINDNMITIKKLTNTIKSCMQAHKKDWNKNRATVSEGNFTQDKNLLLDKAETINIESNKTNASICYCLFILTIHWGMQVTYTAVKS